MSLECLGRREGVEEKGLFAGFKACVSCESERASQQNTQMLLGADAHSVLSAPSIRPKKMSSRKLVPLRGRNKVGAAEKVSDASDVWSAEDKNALNSVLDRLPKAGLLNWTSCPENQQIICADKEDVLAKTMDNLGNLNLISGLVLSGVIGAALDPLKVKELDPNDQWLGNAYNITAAVCVTLMGFPVRASSPRGPPTVIRVNSLYSFIKSFSRC